MRRLLPLLMLPLLACEDAPDLTGDWFGDAQFGGSASTLAWSIDLEPGAEASTWSGASEFSFDTTDGEVILSFGLEIRVPESDGAEPITLDIDVVDCASSTQGEFNCWSAEGTWDLVDDEISGTFDGVPVNDGTCDFTLERGA